MGERNKRHFYWYLWNQFILLALLLILAVRLITKQKDVDEVNTGEVVVGYIFSVLGGVFLLFVVNLLIFHSVIMSRNVTTWECLSWNKISYLRFWPRKLGSPFNLGCWSNWKLSLRYKQSQGDNFVWKMPLRRPDFVPKP